MARELPPDKAPRSDRYIKWSKYDTGKAWELIKGFDFDRTPDRAAGALRQWAYTHGRKVTINVGPDRITFYIHPE